MLAKLKTNQEEMKASQKGIKSKAGALVSRTDIHQARTEAIEKKMKAKKNINQEKMEAAIRSGQKETNAAISSVRAELEETIKNRMKNVLVSVDKQTQEFRMEIKETAACRVSNDVHRQVEREPQGRFNGHKEGPSQKVRPPDPGRDTSNENPGRVHEACT
jgi:hypothetical protein